MAPSAAAQGASSPAVLAAVSASAILLLLAPLLLAAWAGEPLGDGGSGDAPALWPHALRGRGVAVLLPRWACARGPGFAGEVLDLVSRHGMEAATVYAIVPERSAATDALPRSRVRLWTAAEAGLDAGQAFEGAAAAALRFLLARVGDEGAVFVDPAPGCLPSLSRDARVREALDALEAGADLVGGLTLEGDLRHAVLRAHDLEPDDWGVREVPPDPDRPRRKAPRGCVAADSLGSAAAFGPWFARVEALREGLGGGWDAAAAPLPAAAQSRDLFARARRAGLLVASCPRLVMRAAATTFAGNSTAPAAAGTAVAAELLAERHGLELAPCDKCGAATCSGAEAAGRLTPLRPTRCCRDCRVRLLRQALGAAPIALDGASARALAAAEAAAAKGAAHAAHASRGPAAIDGAPAAVVVSGGLGEALDALSAAGLSVLRRGAAARVSLPGAPEVHATVAAAPAGGASVIGRTAGGLAVSDVFRASPAAVAWLWAGVARCCEDHHAACVFPRGCSAKELWAARTARAYAGASDPVFVLTFVALALGCGIAAKASARVAARAWHSVCGSRRRGGGGGGRFADPDGGSDRGAGAAAAGAARMLGDAAETVVRHAQAAADASMVWRAAAAGALAGATAASACGLAGAGLWLAHWRRASGRGLGAAVAPVTSLREFALLWWYAPGCLPDARSDAAPGGRAGRTLRPGWAYQAPAARPKRHGRGAAAPPRYGVEGFGLPAGGGASPSASATEPSSPFDDEDETGGSGSETAASSSDTDAPGALAGAAGGEASSGRAAARVYYDAMAGPARVRKEWSDRATDERYLAADLYAHLVPAAALSAASSGMPQWQYAVAAASLLIRAWSLRAVHGRAGVLYAAALVWALPTFCEWHAAVRAGSSDKL